MGQGQFEKFFTGFPAALCSLFDSTIDVASFSRARQMTVLKPFIPPP
jgi:hypothetical protein